MSRSRLAILLAGGIAATGVAMSLDGPAWAQMIAAVGLGGAWGAIVALVLGPEKD